MSKQSDLVNITQGDTITVDHANGRVGIGTNSPSHSLDVVGTVTATGFATTGNMTFGDNDKAIFGAGSDLQIYHDGSNSYIADAGTGNLVVEGSAAVYINAYGTGENMAAFVKDGAASLYYDNSKKLATTSTGVDVTGTVTADGLTVDGTTGINVNGIYANLDLVETDITDQNTRFINSGGDFRIDTLNDAKTVSTKRLTLDHTTGDISFYEDTGTTPKFFWKASAESLGIGTSSPASALDVVGTVTADGLTLGGEGLAYFDLGTYSSTAVNNAGLRIRSSAAAGSDNWSGITYQATSGDSTGTYWQQGITTNSGSYSSDLVIKSSTGSTSMKERMRIDSSGNLLVGTTVADNAQLKVRKTITTGDVLRLHNDGAGTGVAFVTFRYGAGQSEVGWIGTNGTTTSYNTSSDYRLKENVVPLAGAANRLAQIPVHRFNFIADRNRIVDGFLAHEVQAIVPEAVTGEKDAVEAIGNITDAEGTVVQENVTEPEELAEGQTWTKTEDRPVYQGIDQSKLTPLLTAALQEALQKIEALEARMAALET